MTTFLPLDATASVPHSPAFLIPSSDPDNHIRMAVNAIVKARRIAVVCGAGISVRAGIPDFRSSAGLFQSKKNKNHPTLVSGKDLFDASVFNSEDTMSLFCQMIAQLSQMSETAKPTEFHRLLRVLNDRRRLLRVYTQNIDSLEMKAGLTFGIPDLDIKATRRPSRRRNGSEASSVEAPSPITVADENPKARHSSLGAIPKCIPLHGTLQHMHCTTCTQSYPLRDYMDSLVAGTRPSCPSCIALEETRQLVGKRSRGVGKLRPAVVLYNEDHRDGEVVGHVVHKDLVGGRAGPDLLLVVGTSLRVPGAKRIVREFSKAVRSNYATPSITPLPVKESTSTNGPVTSIPSSSSHFPTVDTQLSVRTIYLNLDFPTTREWEGVFDLWIRGDAQHFARMVHEGLEKEEEALSTGRECKRKREATGAENEELPPPTECSGKHTRTANESETLGKKRRMREELVTTEHDVVRLSSL